MKPVVGVIPRARPARMEAHVLAEQNVPRYTSYPTAPHFSKGIGPETYASWLTELPPGTEH